MSTPSPLPEEKKVDIILSEEEPVDDEEEEVEEDDEEVEDEDEEVEDEEEEDDEDGGDDPNLSKTSTNANGLTQFLQDLGLTSIEAGLLASAGVITVIVLCMLLSVTYKR
jgi:hypothetical protein